MGISREEALAIAKERGLIPQDYKVPAPSREEAFKLAIERGLIKPREDGAGFLTRTKFSFADSDAGRKQVLEDEYGKGKAIKFEGRWLISDKKGWNFVDEDGLSWNDAADLIGDIPELIGSVAGFVGGSGPASIPAAAAGGAGGRLVKKGIANLLGIDNEQSLIENVKDLGESAAYAGTGQALGLGLVKVGGKILAPFKNKMTPEAIARRDLASKYDVELTPAQITQSPTQGQMENVLHNKIWSSDQLAKFADEKQIKPFNEAIKNITPDKNIDDIGMELINAINTTKQANKEMFKREYGEIASSITKDIDVDSLMRKANDIIGQNVNLPKSAQDTAVKISSEILEKQSNTMTYKELSKLRTNLGELSKSGAATGDVGTAQYKMLKGALDNDFNNFATYNGVGSAKSDVDDAYRIFKNNYENNAVKNIIGTGKKEQLPNEKVVDSFVKSNELNKMNTIINASNSPKLVKDAVVSKVINNSKVADFSNPMYGSDMVTPTRFATQAHKFGNNLSSVKADNVRELGKVAESIKFSDSFANHSNTAPTLMNSSLLGMANPINLLGKAYTSKLGRTLLTDGFNLPGKNKIKTSSSLLGTTFGQNNR